MAYCSANPDRPDPSVIRIRDVAVGSERKIELDAKLGTVRSFQWCPDGKSLLASRVWNYHLGPDESKKEGFDSRVYHIDIEDGKVTVLMEGKRRRVVGAELSPDGKTMFYACSSILRGQDLAALANSLLIRRELASDEEKTLFEFSDRNGWFTWAVSHSGEFVAIALNEEEGNPNARAKKIMVIPSAGGQMTELVRWDERPGAIWDVAWTPDGKGILFVLQTDIFAETPMELWHVSIDTPQPRKIMEADLGGWSGVRVHPDGRRIAFDARRRFHELWVMENIVPATSTSGSQ
jgi:Tol biopolymer transport system component